MQDSREETRKLRISPRLNCQFTTQDSRKETRKLSISPRLNCEFTECKTVEKRQENQD